jgi:hypothetical protein
MSSMSSACRCATGVRRRFGPDRSDDAMLTSAFSSPPLLPRGGSYLATPAPRLDLAQRPSVLARPQHMPQQLSLFGPPGGRR